MLQSTNIPQETNHIPSGERWEYKEFVSFLKEQKIDFINRIAYISWQLDTLEYDSLTNRYYGIFKRKLIAI